MKTTAETKNPARKIFLVVLSFLFPPLAVLEHGCGAILLVTLLWIFGWLPGTVLALYLTLTDHDSERRRKMIPIPLWDNPGDYEGDVDEQKRKGAYIRLADGEIAEVVEDDGAQPIKRKHGL